MNPIPDLNIETERLLIVTVSNEYNGDKHNLAIEKSDVPFSLKNYFENPSKYKIIGYINIDRNSFDTCEGGRWSAYITSDMKMLPCSFDNQDMRWAYDISNDTIQNAWDSKQFEDFRNHFRNSCSNCSNKYECMGGCPIRRQIVLCDRKEKDLYNNMI